MWSQIVRGVEMGGVSVGAAVFAVLIFLGLLVFGYAIKGSEIQAAEERVTKAGKEAMESQRKTIEEENEGEWGELIRLLGIKCKTDRVLFAESELPADSRATSLLIKHGAQEVK